MNALNKNARGFPIYHKMSNGDNRNFIFKPFLNIHDYASFRALASMIYRLPLEIPKNVSCFTTNPIKEHLKHITMSYTFKCKYYSNASL